MRDAAKEEAKVNGKPEVISFFIHVQIAPLSGVKNITGSVGIKSLN